MAQESAGGNPRQNVSFPAASGKEAYGYLALPPSGSGPGLIVIQEWWGLESSLARTVDQLAAAGFVALAPDLYGGPATHDADEAGKLMNALPAEQAARDLSGAVDYLYGHPAVTGNNVGALGICMGGGFVLTLGAQQGDRLGAVVAWYPAIGGDIPSYAGLTAPVQAHIGSKDAFTPADRSKQIEDALRATGVQVEFFAYDAGHAFGNEENLLGTYDPTAAELAFDRTTAFLHQQLG